MIKFFFQRSKIVTLVTSPLLIWREYSCIFSRQITTNRFHNLHFSLNKVFIDHNLDLVKNVNEPFLDYFWLLNEFWLKKKDFYEDLFTLRTFFVLSVSAQSFNRFKANFSLHGARSDFTKNQELRNEKREKCWVKNSYRNGRNNPTLIFENLKPVEISKNNSHFIWTFYVVSVLPV